MNKIEALRAELKCREMVEGTGLKWWNVVKFDGKVWNETYPVDFSLSVVYYEFALGVVEGKPVWKDDKLWCLVSNHRFIVKGICNNGAAFEYSREYQGRQCVGTDSVSWNPPAPKTVMVEMTIEDAKYWNTMGEFVSNSFNINDIYHRACKRFYDAVQKSLNNLEI